MDARKNTFMRLITFDLNLLKYKRIHDWSYQADVCETLHFSQSDLLYVKLLDLPKVLKAPSEVEHELTSKGYFSRLEVEDSMMHQNVGTRARPIEKLIPVTDLNPYLTCGICKGYLIDATTITECLHSFCRTCIVKHTAFYLHCPECNVQIHPTDPLLFCRPDNLKQDVVYKLLPRVYRDEQKRRKLFYKEQRLKNRENQGIKKTIKRKKRLIVKTDPLVSLVLEYIGASEGAENYDYEPVLKNFIRVAAKATVENLQNFLRKKMNLDKSWEVNVFCDTSLVDKSFTLQYVRDIFYAGEDTLIFLQYGIVEPEPVPFQVQNETALVDWSGLPVKGEPSSTQKENPSLPLKDTEIKENAKQLQMNTVTDKCFANTENVPHFSSGLDQEVHTISIERVGPAKQDNNDQVKVTEFMHEEVKITEFLQASPSKSQSPAHVLETIGLVPKDRPPSGEERLIDLSVDEDEIVMDTL